MFVRCRSYACLDEEKLQSLQQWIVIECVNFSGHSSTQLNYTHHRTYSWMGYFRLILGVTHDYCFFFFWFSCVFERGLACVVLMHWILCVCCSYIVFVLLALLFIFMKLPQISSVFSKLSFFFFLFFCSFSLFHPVSAVTAKQLTSQHDRSNVCASGFCCFFFRSCRLLLLLPLIAYGRAHTQDSIFKKIISRHTYIFRCGYFFSRRCLCTV